MKLVRAGVVGLFLGVAGAVVFGLGATLAVESVGAVRDGGSGMASALIFGPIGFLAGALLGVSVSLRGAHGSSRVSQVSMRASLAIAVVGIVLCAANVLHARSLQ